MNKFGVDKEEKGPNKNRLWAKVTKEYNNITGNGHTKARLNKKWQNIKHQRKLKRQKLFDHEADDDPDALVDEDGKFDLLKFDNLQYNMLVLWVPARIFSFFFVNLQN